MFPGSEAQHAQGTEISIASPELHEADWYLLYKVWFFELSPPLKGAKWVKKEVNKDHAIFEATSPYSKDIAKSPSMAQVKAEYFKWLKKGHDPSKKITLGFQFKGEESGRKGYYTFVEWFIGGYSASIVGKQVPGKEGCYDVSITVENNSHWFSGTRLPETWKRTIKELTGVKPQQFLPIQSAPRGEVFYRRIVEICDLNRARMEVVGPGPLEKLGNRLYSVFDTRPPLERMTLMVPPIRFYTPMMPEWLEKLSRECSVGGNFHQTYHIKARWHADECKEDVPAKDEGPSGAKQ